MTLFGLLDSAAIHLGLGAQSALPSVTELGHRNMSIHRQSPSLPSGSIDREAPPKWYDQWRWYAVGTPLEEKKLLVKLDFMILVFG